ncbi:MAG: DNA translocase FtsK [Actinobacteria bacterium]|nr:MAG: DNA translocase FtsK [Actinomycetota bacterium]
MPPAKKAPAKKKRPKPRARRSAGWRAQLPLLEQHHVDLIGLALVAAGIFLVFPLWMRWDGGRGGEALVDGLRYLVGVLAYGAPVALCAIGAICVLRPVLPAVRPFRAGGLCLLAALTLALAAGTLGLGPAGARHGFWHTDFLSERGGIVGEALYYSASNLIGAVGAHILAVFLFAAAILLLTGASIAGVVKATAAVTADTTRALRRGEAELRRAKPHVAPREMPAEFLPPEPDDTEPIVHATHVEVRLPELVEPEVEEPVAEDPETGEIVVQEEPHELPPAPVQAEDVDWRLPEPQLLKRSSADQTKPDTAGQEKISAQLLEALSHFGIEAKVVATVAGPHITRYELRLAPGIKMSKVAQLKDDLAYALAATDIRILAPIPGKQAVGIEVPNQHRRIVRLGDVYQDPPKDWSPLTVWLGKDVSGKAIGADLAKMPHLLVAGTTGAGKSGAINAMLSSILLRATPEEVRMVLVDPKQVELNHYEAVPHLLTPVITSPRMAANALQNLVREMEWRYGIMSMARTRSLPELNKHRVSKDDEPLPYILCVIDELADLMMVAPADVEDSIIRLAQKARAVGIHLVLATQSPRVDVITGMIKANVPSLIAFAVSSQTDSRVILDQNGAESLLGQGDMLFSPVGSSRLQRIQGAYIDEAQIESLTRFWAQQGEPVVREDLLEEVEPEQPADKGDDEFDPDEDPLLGDAIQLVVEMGTASTSMLQRRLRLGYTRAGRLIDMLERRGVISGYEGSKPRQVLVTEADLPRVLSNLKERGDNVDAPDLVRVPDEPEELDG